MNSKPVYVYETNLYPLEINSQMFIDISKIECIEEVKDFEDWFTVSSIKVVNLYMFPEDATGSGKRNVVTVGFIG